MLEHVPFPLKLLEEARRVLKPNGILILTCPQTYWLHEAPRDFYRFTRYGLVELLENQAGFQIHSLRPIGGTLDFAIDFISKVCYGFLLSCPLLGHQLARRTVVVFQRIYMLVRNSHAKSERFAFGHIVIARKKEE